VASDGKEGEMADYSQMEIEERARNAIRLADGPANDIIAGTMASVSPIVRGTIAFTVAGTIQAVVSSALPAGFLPGMVAAGIFGGVVALVPGMLRRPVYIIVTPGEFICYRVSEMNQQPARAKVLFRASPRAVRVKCRKYKKGKDTNIRIRFASRGPGEARRQQSRHLDAWQPLTVSPSWHQEFGEVLTALRAAGATMHPALLGVTATLATAESPQRD
jgi:hypothetical protein